MDDRVLGATGSGVSAGRRRRLRAMIRGYRIRRVAGVVLAATLWALWWSPTLGQVSVDTVMTGSRYSAPLWSWIAAIVVAAGLSVAGLVIGWWFLRKRRRMIKQEATGQEQ